MGRGILGGLPLEFKEKGQISPPQRGLQGVPLKFFWKSPNLSVRLSRSMFGSVFRRIFRRRLSAFGSVFRGAFRGAFRGVFRNKLEFGPRDSQAYWEVPRPSTYYALFYQT